MDFGSRFSSGRSIISGRSLSVPVLPELDCVTERESLDYSQESELIYSRTVISY